MTAANELHLHELVDYLQKYLIENQFKWMEQHFELIYSASFQSCTLLGFQKFCTDLMAKSPKKFLNHLILLYFLKNLYQKLRRQREHFGIGAIGKRDFDLLNGNFKISLEKLQDQHQNSFFQTL